MKHLALLTCLIFAACSTYAQKLIEQELPDDVAAVDTVVWKDSVNTLINAYKKTPTAEALLELINLLKHDDVQQDENFKPVADSLLRAIDSGIVNGDSTKVGIAPFAVEPKPVDKEKSPEGQCKALLKVKGVRITKTPDAAYDVSLVDNKDNPIAGFALQQPEETLFYELVEKSLYNLCDGEKLVKEDEAHAKGILEFLKKKDLFQEMLKASLRVQDEDVIAGKLNLRKKVAVEVTKLTDQVTKKTTGQKEEFIVHHVQLQFQDGFIENMIVLGKIPESNRMLKFENRYPIPFSTRRDYRRLYDINLYERTIFLNRFRNALQITSVKMKLGDLLDYTQLLDIDTKDYSPANQVWAAEIKNDETSIDLKKEKTSKILELRVYTDLKGIENENPNGLVQVELAKKINFLNQRREVGKRNVFNIGLFNYITPSFTLSKIEEKRKRLPIRYMGSTQADPAVPNTYASKLQLLQYEAFRVGGELALVTADVPGIKGIFTFKSGLYFGRTLTTDTLRAQTDSVTFEPVPDNNIVESGVNSFQFVPEISLQVYPDRRYGFALSYRAINYRIMSRTVKQVTDSADYASFMKGIKGDRTKIDSYPFRRWLGAAEIFAFYRPSAYNQLFFRYRFIYDMAQVKVNFHQVQLGIATYLTHTDKDKNESTRPSER
jgi:hypothetical protein